MKTKSGYSKTRHGRVHYRETGQGPALVLLHATPRSSRSFAAVVPFLAEHHRVITPDTLGFGESDPLPDHATMSMLAESLCHVVDDLGIASISLFGLHTGNKIAAAFAEAYPDRLDRLVLCGMTHSIIVDRSKREAAIQSLVAKPFSRTDISESEKLDRQQGASSFDAMYAANYGFDLADALRRVRVPTLIIELATPQEDHLGRQASEVADLLSDGDSATFEGSDRDALDQRPQELASLILGYTAPAAGSSA